MLSPCTVVVGSGGTAKMLPWRADATLPPGMGALQAVRLPDGTTEGDVHAAERRPDRTAYVSAAFPML